MIVDGFTFFNELDILEIRLEELYPVVDHFVIVESDLTFRGDKKPYFFEENRRRFKKYDDKIVYLKHEGNPTYSRDGQGPWMREYNQRDFMDVGFKTLCKPTDFVMVSDVDEIPRREVIDGIDVEEIISLNMYMHYYGLNVRDGLWGAAKILPYSDFTTAQNVRETEAKRFCDDAGWHFSYLGTPEAIALKLKSFSHWELDTPETTNVDNILRRMQHLEDVWGHGHKYARVPVDDTFPHAVRENPEYYEKYIW